MPMTRTLLAALMLTAAAEGGEVLDRVAVAVGPQVVTLGAVLRQLRMEALATGEAPVDTVENRRRAASRLIDQGIVLREIELSRFLQPSMAEAEAALERYLKQSGQTPEQFQARVKQMGFSEGDFQRELQARISVARFIDFRFAPGIQVSDEEVDKYYREEYTPQYRKLSPGAAVPPLEEARDGIVRVLTARTANAAMEQWLERTREALGVKYFDEAFRIGASGVGASAIEAKAQ
jgi:hypothetical protein